MHKTHVPILRNSSPFAHNLPHKIISLLWHVFQIHHCLNKKQRHDWISESSWMHRNQYLTNIFIQKTYIENLLGKILGERKMKGNSRMRIHEIFRKIKFAPSRIFMQKYLHMPPVTTTILLNAFYIFLSSFSSNHFSVSIFSFWFNELILQVNTIFDICSLNSEPLQPLIKVN